MSSDQRQHDRAETKVAVIYYFDDESQARRIEEATLTMDLSGGGLSMVVRQALEQGRAIHLKLLLRNQAVQCRGKVAHVSEAGSGSWRVGVALDLSPEQQKQLQSFAEASGR